MRFLFFSGHVHHENWLSKILPVAITGTRNLAMLLVFQKLTHVFYYFRISFENRVMKDQIFQDKDTKAGLPFEGSPFGNGEWRSYKSTDPHHVTQVLFERIVINRLCAFYNIWFWFPTSSVFLPKSSITPPPTPLPTPPSKQKKKGKN